MPKQQNPLEQHYDRPGLVDAIRRALEGTGADPSALDPELIASFDEFHIRGRKASRELIAMARLSEADHVLDVGCGVGGPARRLAGEVGCRVTGLDAVASFCQAAEWLTRAADLQDRVRFEHGDATNMPFASGTFDAVWLQHVNMNIEDKAQLFSEIFRVLRPGGRLLLHEVCAGSMADPWYPVPWASDDTISFLVTPDELLAAARASGLTEVERRDDTAASVTWFRRARAGAQTQDAETPWPLGIDLLMGPNSPTKVKNLVRNLEEDRLRVLMGVLERLS